jgi:hypothetical protein
MKNCLIFGSGRSGTSLLGGIMHQAGYYMGDNLYKPHLSNPKGFFECHEINEINEIILSGYYVYSKWSPVQTFLKKGNQPETSAFYRWLASINPDVTIRNDNKRIANRIKEALSKKPYCYKDPRLCYTLPVWNPYLVDDTVLVCVFREPHNTVKSILNECKTREYLRGFHLTQRKAFQLWNNIYLHVLKNASELKREIFFIHYRQIIDGSGLPPLENKLETRLDREFADFTLNRSVSNEKIPASSLEIYRDLCRRADYRNDLSANMD